MLETETRDGDNAIGIEIDPGVVARDLVGNEGGGTEEIEMAAEEVVVPAAEEVVDDITTTIVERARAGFVISVADLRILLENILGRGKGTMVAKGRMRGTNITGHQMARVVTLEVKLTLSTEQEKRRRIIVGTSAIEIEAIIIIITITSTWIAETAVSWKTGFLHRTMVAATGVEDKRGGAEVAPAEGDREVAEDTIKIGAGVDLVLRMGVMQAVKVAKEITIPNNRRKNGDEETGTSVIVFQGAVIVTVREIVVVTVVREGKTLMETIIAKVKIVAMGALQPGEAVVQEMPNVQAEWKKTTIVLK